MRFAVHVAHGDLALGIGTQKGQAAILAQLRLALDQTVGVINGRRHQLGGFVAGITKHQALVAGAGVQVVITGVVDALGDVVALLVVGHQHRATFVVNAVVRVVVADALEGVARDLDVVHRGVGGDFTRQQDQAGVAQGLCGDPRFGVLFENCVKNRIGNLVGHLVGVAFRNRFRGE